MLIDFWSCKHFKSNKTIFGFSFRIIGLYDVVVHVKKMLSRELLNLCRITLLKHASYGKQSFKNNSDLQCHTKITLTFRPSVNDNGKFVFLILLDGGNASVWPQVWKLVIWRHRVATLRGRKWGSTYHEPSVEYFNNWQNLLDKWHDLERPWNGHTAWRQMKWRQTTQRWVEIIRTITIVKYRQKTRLSFQCAKRLDLKFRQSPVGYEN